MTVESLLHEADRCVKCGLCLPHCPTFRLTGDENNSPRGRIALAQALASGQLPATGAARGHLERCLGCRACERACPSGVAYGTIIDGARSLIQQADPVRRRRLGRLLDRVAASGRATGGVRLLRLYQRLGLQRLVAHLPWPRLTRLNRLLPPLAAPADDTVATDPDGGGSGIALFLGCVARHSEPGVAVATRRLCAALGIALRIPPGQGCCGALHHHSGLGERAETLAAGNRAAFANATAIVSTSSACGAELATDPALPSVQDVTAFVADRPWPDALALRPLAARVAVHEPCSHHYGPSPVAAIYRLLARIPALEVIPLAGNAVCCGGAGGYLLDQPELCDRLGGLKRDALERAAPDLVVTTSSGCRIQLAAQLRGAGRVIEVLHPVELVARQLPT